MSEKTGKLELVAKLAERTGLPKTKAQDVLNALFGVDDGLIVELLAEPGDKVGVQGFGTFSLVRRPAREGSSPITRAPITIPARNAVTFKPGKPLVARVQSPGPQKSASA